MTILQFINCQLITGLKLRVESVFTLSSKCVCVKIGLKEV